MERCHRIRAFFSVMWKRWGVRGCCLPNYPFSHTRFLTRPLPRSESGSLYQRPYISVAQYEFILFTERIYSSRIKSVIVSYALAITYSNLSRNTSRMTSKIIPIKDHIYWRSDPSRNNMYSPRIKSNIVSNALAITSRFNFIEEHIANIKNYFNQDHIYWGSDPNRLSLSLIQPCNTADGLWGPPR